MWFFYLNLVFIYITDTYFSRCITQCGTSNNFIIKDDIKKIMDHIYDETLKNDQYCENIITSRKAPSFNIKNRITKDK